jgi:hypothetical protein
MLCLVFHKNLKCHILTRTTQRCGSYGGQRLAIFCLTYSLINFHKLSLSDKKLLSAINKKILSVLERQIILVNLTKMNTYLRSDVYVSHLF